jgi:hypothetical protein
MQEALIHLLKCIDDGARLAEEILEDFNTVACMEEALQMLQESLRASLQHGVHHCHQTVSGSDHATANIPFASEYGHSTLGRAENKMIDPETDLCGILSDLLEVNRMRKAALGAAHRRALHAGWRNDESSGEVQDGFCWIQSLC